MVSKKSKGKGKVASESKEKAKSKKASKKPAEDSVEVVEEAVSPTEEAVAATDGDNHPASTSATTEKGKPRGVRGSAQMYKVLVRKAKNKKIKVEYDRSGNPCGKTRATLQSYIGMLARQMVPITIASWPKVDKELKEKLWIDIQDTFKVAPESRRLVLSSAGAKWRQFKTNLTINEVLPYCGQKKKLRNPPKKYAFVGKQNWREFVKSRCTEEWLETHKLSKERVKKRKYHHRTARFGYIGVEEKMREEEHLGPDDEIDRVLIWKKAHTPKDGVVDEILKPVIEKIDELLEKQERGELEIDLATGNDILTQALGTQEHSGRVRGVAGVITPKNFFGLPKQRRVSITKAELLARDKERDRALIETKKLLVESQAKTQKLINKAIADFSSRLTSSQGGTPLADARAPITPISDNFSTYDALHHAESGLDVNADAEDDLLFGSPPTGQGNGICEFALETITNIVAFGTVIEGEGMRDSIHGLPWPEGCVRVSIAGDVQGDQSLPFPIPNAKILLVKDAIGSHVPWPEKWVIRKNSAKPKKKPKQAQKLFGKSELPLHVPKSCQLLYKHAKDTMAKTGMSITTELEEDVFGVPKQLIVLRENVLDLLQLSWIGAGVLDAYMAYLYECVAAKNETDLYAFVDSGATTTYTRASFVPYLVTRLKQGQNDCIFMIPHNPGKHWILTVIWESEIFIIDFVPRPSVYKGWEKAVQSVVKQFNEETSNGDGKMPKVTHLNGAPMQPGGHECGYYVMRFMKEIVEDDNISFSTKWAVARSRKSYSQQKIDEVRVELAEFIESLL